MSSKKQILDKLRQYQPDTALSPLPNSGPWIEFDDRLAQFESMIAAVGGTTVRIGPGAAELADALEQITPYCTAQEVCAIGVEIPRQNVHLPDVADPHSLASLDFVILRATLGVAENGAIWIPGNFTHRSAIFLTQHLGIVLQADQIVHHMHAAYANIELPQPSR